MGLQVSFELEGELGDYVAAVADGGGLYANVEEYLRDLIRKDVDRQRADFEMFKGELREAFAASEDDAIEITADEFLAQMRSERA